MMKKETKKKWKHVPVYTAKHLSDTFHIYLIMYCDHFEMYSNKIQSKNTTQEFYTGSYKSSGDTTFLNYYKKRKLVEAKYYLVINAIRNEIKYPLKNNKQYLLNISQPRDIIEKAQQKCKE